MGRCGAGHAGVGFALQRLIERGGAGGDEADAKQGVEGFAMKGREVGAEVAEIDAGGGGDEDHEGDADLKKDGVISQERRRGGAACRDLNGSGGVAHRASVSRAGRFHARVRTGR